MPTKTECRFDRFTLDLEDRRLCKDGQQIHLTPKVFDTLTVLFRNRDRVVSKKELIESVWPDCHVTEANLAQNVSVLRRALGETDSGTKYIATFPGRGYRFIAEAGSGSSAASPAVKSLNGEAASPAVAASGPRRKRLAFAAALAVAAAAGSVGWYVRPAPSALAIGPAHSITRLRGREFQPAIAPDGSRIAFTYHAGLDSALRIGVTGAKGEEEPRLISSPGEDANSPAWSPDGSTLAYLQRRGGRLLIVLHRIGQEPRDLVEVFPERNSTVERQLDWSPDGRLLAVSDRASAEEPFHLTLVHIGERRKTTLTAPPALSDGDFNPRFSPDGKRLAFVRVSARASMDAFLIDMPGSNPVALSGQHRPIGDVDWTPDSRFVLIAGERDGENRLWRVDPSGPDPVWQRTSLAPQTNIQISVSRNSGALAYSGSQPDQNIWRGDLDSKPPAWQRLIGSTADEYLPVFSPDGQRIVFLTERTGDLQLWLRDQGRERQLTSVARPSYASWTGQGNGIVFSSTLDRKLYRMTVDGGMPAAIPIDGPVGSHSAVSLDGKSVFFVRRFYIYRASSEGGPAELVTDQGGFPLRLSPGGEWLYYVRHRFSGEVWRVRTSGGAAERLTGRLQPGCWACWAAGSSKLIYVSKDSSDRAAKLERLDLANGLHEDAGELPGRLPPLGRASLAMAPDERTMLAVVSEAGSGDVQYVRAAPWTAPAK